MYRLDNPVRHYAWGSTTFIPELLGVPNADGRPWAELWMGAHPSAPSIVVTETDRIGLDALIARDPERTLGRRVVDAFGPRLPFLFKVLAAAQPLSIQAHPDQARARAGYARENAAGIPADAPHRNYRDDSHKPELLVALGPFVALKGFRDPKAIAADVASLEALEPWTSALPDEPASLRTFFEGVMRMPADARTAVLDELRAFVRDASHPRAGWARELLALHPDDIGVLAPYYLELVELGHGEGLYLPAGELHAYLGGCGLEVMASSDNVLRGGLTPKHVDVEELLATLRFEPSPAQVLRAQQADGVEAYDTPAAEFRLERIVVDGERGYSGHGSIAIALCLEGEVSARAGPHVLVLRRGHSVLVTGDQTKVELKGRGEVWAVRVP